MNYRQPFKGSYPISQRFGETVTDPLGHTGIDYACPAGTPILASAAGTVMAAGWDSTGFGWRVIIWHTSAVSTLYAHLREIKVSKGQTVEQSEVIGFSGYSGNVVPSGPDGAHLHFEARRRWNIYRTESFDPMMLPLMSFADPVETSQNLAKASQKLKDADAFKAGDLLKVQNTLGVRAFFDTSFSYDRVTGFQQGDVFYFTGETTVNKANGLTYMRVVPAGSSVWIAVHDEDTQLLDKAD